ncbi:MAG: PAS domain S-box protein, partial [Bryobacteraceae bacterium]|nr:PAS domain S-box protein [Bryobacteraceae bacterium]
RQAEEARRISEECLTFALEVGGGVGTWDWDVADDCLYCNARFAQMFSVDPERAVLGVPISEFLQSVHLDDRARAEERLAHALKTGADYAEEYRVTGADGVVRWLYARGRCQLDEQGRPGRFPGVAFEITDRKQTEVALQESEQFARSVVDSSPDCVKVLDRDGILLSMNSEGCRQMEMVDFGTFANHHWVDFWPEGSRADARKAVAAAREGITARFQGFCPTLTGEPRWWEVIVAPIRDASSHPVRILCVSRDITERLQAETALKESEQRFRNLADNAPVMVWVTDSDGSCTYLSRSWYQFTGQTEHTGLGFGWLDAVHPEDRPEAGRAFHEANSSRQPFRVEYRLRRQDGEYCWAIDAAMPRRGPEGSFLGYIGSVIEITERKQAEVALAERARLNALGADVGAALTQVAELSESLQSCAEAMVRHLDAAFARVWTLASSEPVLELQASAGMYTHVNGPHARVPVGSFKIGLIAQERRPHLTNDVLNDPRIGDLSWARQEGMVAFAGYPLIVEDRLVGVLGLFARHPLEEGTLTALASVADTIAIGIERKKAEVALTRQAEELKRSNTDLEQFAFAAAHDLQEPLRMVTSYTQLLARQLGGRLDDDTRQFMDQVVGGSRRMSLLLQDLLSFTEASRDQDRRPAAVRMNDVLNKVLGNLQGAIEDSGASISAEPLPTVFGHETHFVQLFQNLIGNAIKYRGAAVPEVRITASKVATDWILYVKDNGIGIAPEHQLRIFGVFKRLHGKEIPGTGIGLAICQRVVERNGGRIWVESEGKDQGSTFCVKLPAFQVTSPMTAGEGLSL